MRPRSFTAPSLAGTPQDMPMGPNDFYTIFKLQGRDAAAGCTLRPDESSQGIPPHWMIYIAVDNADAAVSKAQQLGGKILAPAFDVMDAGRMAVIQDPTGAIFCPWQANKSTGIQIAQVPGTLCWADLNTARPQAGCRVLLRPFRMADRRRPERSVRIPAHQERRALHWRHSTYASSPDRNARALDGLLPGR